MPRSLVDSRMQLAGYGLFGLVALAGLSQAKVQVLARGQVLAHASESGKFDQNVPDNAKRGRILSADMRPLAMDEDSYVLQVDFKKVPHSEGFFADLSAATGIPATEFQSLAETSTDVKNWKDPLSEEQSNKVRKVKYLWRADGLAVSASHRRTYPLAEFAAGITGTVVEGEPLSGLELSQDVALAGKDGITAGLVDRAGHILPMRLDKNKSFPKTDGVDVQTTIDFDLQQAAGKAIREAVEKNNADTGSVVIMDPKTGDVLAMANWPSFDPMSEGGKVLGSSRPPSDFNSVMKATLEPGSTFKLLTLAETLDKGLITTRDHFYCSGSDVVGRTTFQCDRHEHHGDMLIGDVIAKSCNVTASRWSRKVGHDDFFSYLEDLGLLDQSGMGLPEKGTRLLTDDPSPTLQLALLGFGQAISVVPIRLASAFSMLGNDGQQMFPRLITRIGAKQFPPEVAKQVVKPESARLVLSCMEAVMDSPEGTGYGLRIPGYRLAGKTGTAERKRGKGGGGHVSNFVGFVPAPNPKALILVMIDNPKAGAYYGAAVAGPVYKKLAAAVIRRFAIAPTESRAGIPPEVAELMLHRGSAEVAEAQPASPVAGLSRRARRT